jgi:hypothetical protein
MATSGSCICAVVLYCLDVDVAVCEAGCWGRIFGHRKGKEEVTGATETISMIFTCHVLCYDGTDQMYVVAVREVGIAYKIVIRNPKGLDFILCLETRP